MNIICQNKKIKADKICNIKDLKNEKHIVVYTECCPYVNSNNPACQKCYGRIACDIVKQNDNKITKTILRDSYTEKHGKIKKLMECSNLIENMIIESYDVSTGSSSSGKPWIAYDRPSDWKTSCVDCKNRCKAKGLIPMCQNREENIKNGFPENFCNKQKQRRIYIY